MLSNNTSSFTAFSNGSTIAAGHLENVVKAAKLLLDQGTVDQVLIFDDQNGRQTDIDLSGSLALILAHLPSSETPIAAGPPKAGRPKLGVTAKEVTLLPRHWSWLDQQPGGASVTLRKLVEEAKRGDNDAEKNRRAQEASYRFLLATAGNLPNFEEAIRALFASDSQAFETASKAWPEDLRNYATRLGELNKPAAPNG